MVWNPFSKGRRPEPENPASDPEAASSAKIPIVVSREGEDRSGGSVDGGSVVDSAKTVSGAVGATLVDFAGAHASEATSAAQAPHPGPTPEPSRPAEAIREDVIGVLRTIFDPEIPVNVYELGLVYEINVTPPADVQIRMTLTSPACPVAGSLPPEVETKVAAIPGVTSAKVELVWDPPWSPDKMTEAARLQLNI